MTTAKVAISADFLTAFAHLPRQVQAKLPNLSTNSGMTLLRREFTTKR